MLRNTLKFPEEDELVFQRKCMKVSEVRAKRDKKRGNIGVVDDTMSWSVMSSELLLTTAFDDHKNVKSDISSE